MSSRETDQADRRAREASISRNLAEARRGRDRLRDLADQEAPEKDDS